MFNMSNLSLIQSQSQQLSKCFQSCFHSNPSSRVLSSLTLSSSVSTRSSTCNFNPSLTRSASTTTNDSNKRFSGAPKRHDLKRRTELPNAPDRRPLLLSFVILAIASWSLFASYANNKERLSTSVFRSVLVQLKDDPKVRQRLGEPVMLVPSSWGEPWVNGAVNMMQGKVDVSFKIQGSKGITATAYFTSIRRSPHSPFEVLRFLVIPDPPIPKKFTSSSSASSSSSNPSDQIDMSPISLLGEDPGDLEIMRDGNGNLFQNQGAGETIGEKGRRGIVTVHDDQGELSLKRL